MGENLVQRGKKVLASVLGHYTEVEVTNGAGCYLYGVDGKEYLDFATGIATASTGHCHPTVVKAIQDQSAKLIHACAGVVYYEPNIALAEKLVEITPFKAAKTFFTNSGGEAVEGAMKLARYVTGRSKLVAFQGGFHGRSFGALSLTSSKDKYREGYDPILPDTHVVGFEISELEALGPDLIAGVIIEPILGEGGYVPIAFEFLQELREFCDKHGVLLIFDEVQSGFGRTGKWFACEHSGVVPDVLLLAKGIASGMPLGAIVAEAELFDKWPTSSHGGTYTGNPVACAAGVVTIDILDVKLGIRNGELGIKNLGSDCFEELEKLKLETSLIRDVRGMGLMIGVEFVDGDVVKKVRAACLEKGLILISCGPGDCVIRLCPPLIVGKKEIDIALRILRESVLGLT